LPLLLLGDFWTEQFRPAFHPGKIKDILHLLEVILRETTTDEVKFLVEFISSLVCHISSQLGTEPINHSVAHVVYIEITPQLKFQLLAKTRAFKGLS
jgi:hypothetical protein